MLNYFLYRINTQYDGFIPSLIPERSQQGDIVYNWRAYIETLDRGDLVLTYFFGAGCRRGVFAVTRINRINLRQSSANVRASVVASSTDDREPLIGVDAEGIDIGDLLSRRMRGAEIVLPSDREEAVYNTLAGIDGLLDRCHARGIILPGAPDFPAWDVTDTPFISRGGMSASLIRSGVIGAFWIRPNQAAWIRRSPNWLIGTTREFKQFKGGDMIDLALFADAMDSKLRTVHARPSRSFSAIVGVPLNEEKRHAGEVDRVALLADALSDRTRLDHEEVFELRGNVSRRRYKNLGRSTTQFVRDYTSNLIIRPRKLRRLAATGKPVILVDDVYTDGLTTRTISEACRSVPGCESLEVQVVTLGIMSKMANLSQRQISSWS